MKLFEDFTQNKIKEDTISKDKTISEDTSDYPAPTQLIIPAENDTGFNFMKKRFSKKIKRFDVGYFSE